MRASRIILHLIVIVILLRGGVRAADNCFICHETAGDKSSELFKHDIHFKKGITCAGCHGGNANTDDMDQAMNPKEGFLGVPKGDEISKRCVVCHAQPEKIKFYGSTLRTDQWELLQTSVHAQLTLTGRERITQCSTCHGSHGIVSVKDPSSPVYPTNVVKTCTRCHANATLMRSYNPSLPVDQLEKYRTSIHGKRNAKGDVKAAECVSCHGSHDIRSAKDLKSKVYTSNLPATCATCHSDKHYMKVYAIPTDQFEKFSKSIHGIMLLQKHDRSAPSCNSCHGNHGAAPPGVESVSKVCGTCHVLNEDLFSTSPHKKAFDERKLPECETCHGNHEIVAATDQLLGVTAEAICSRCHSENGNIKGYQVAKMMRGLLDSLVSVEENCRSLVNEAEQKGMEVSEAKFKLRDIQQARYKSRTIVHAFNEEKFKEIAENGIKTANLIEMGLNNTIHEYYFRRIGLAISTLIIAFLAVSLFLYIRRLERRKKIGE